MTAQYRIVEALGRGPVGTVYLAEATTRAGTERVALKLFDPRRATPAVIERLDDAMPRLGWVKDARVVRVRGVVRFDGAVGVVSDLIEGCDLRQLLRLGQAPPGPAIDITTALAGALHAALFQSGPDGEPIMVAHGDVRPSNVVLTRWGDVRLLDIGVLRAVTGGDPDEARRLDPELRMAPEVSEGVYSPASDVFGVGLLLFELLAGRPFPRAGADAAAHRAALSQAMNGLHAAGVDPLAVTLAEALLAWEPEARPLARDVERLARELRRNVGGATLREWAAQTVPVALDDRVAPRDPLVGTVLTAIAAPERPVATRAFQPLPLPAPPGHARLGEIGPDDEETVTVTTPGRQTPAPQVEFTPPPELLPDSDEPTDMGEPEVTETLVAKIDTAPPRIAMPDGPSMPVVPPPSMANLVGAPPPRRGLSVVSGGRDAGDPPTNPRPTAPPPSPRLAAADDPPTNPRPTRGSGPHTDPRVVLSRPPRPPELSVVAAAPATPSPAAISMPAATPAPVPNVPGTPRAPAPNVPVTPPAPVPTVAVTPPTLGPSAPVAPASPPASAMPSAPSPVAAPPVRPPSSVPPAPVIPPSIPVPAVTPLDLAPPVAPPSREEEPEPPREEYRETSREFLVMAMPAGCFLLVLLALGGFYAWLNWR